MKRILTRHRRTLLDTVHAEQKKIDCLDYFFYKTVHAEQKKIDCLDYFFYKMEKDAADKTGGRHI